MARCGDSKQLRPAAGHLKYVGVAKLIEMPIRIKTMKGV
jgi:hypothetical protein